MSNLTQVKEILYDILLQPDDAHDSVAVSQQMGVSLTNSMRKDGVNIIQYSQISKNVVSGVAKALKAIDLIQKDERLIRAPVIEAVIEEKDHLEIVLDEILSENMSWKEMKGFLARKLFMRAYKKYPEKKDLAERLGMGMQSINKLISTHLRKK